MDAMITHLLAQGPLGLWVAWLIYSCAKKDDRNAFLTDKLFEKTEADAERFNKMAMTMREILIAVQTGAK